MATVSSCPLVGGQRLLHQHAVEPAPELQPHEGESAGGPEPGRSTQAELVSVVKVDRARMGKAIKGASLRKE